MFRMQSKLQYADYQTSPNETSAAAAMADAHQSESQLLLPPSKVPVFRGRTKQWACFREASNALMSSNDQMSAALKVVYLKSCVRGDAACILDPLDNSDSSYNDAWELLALRYDATGTIVSKYVQNLLQLERVSDESAESLSELLNDFQCNVHILKELEEPTDQCCTFLFHLLLNKIDSSTRQEWKNNVACSDLPHMSELVHFIEARCKAKKFATSSICSLCKTSPYHRLPRCTTYIDKVLSYRKLSENKRAKKNMSHTQCEEQCFQQTGLNYVNIKHASKVRLLLSLFILLVPAFISMYILDYFLAVTH